MDWEDELEWSKGQWLKGMNLSGSQAEYIISVMVGINKLTRSQLLKSLVEEVHKLQVKPMEDYLVTGYSDALDDVIKLLENYE